MNISRHQTQACLDAWIACEELLVELAEMGSRVSKQLSKVVDECAYACLGVFHAIKSLSLNIKPLAQSCMEKCTECARYCAKEQQTAFLLCAQVCSKCAASINQLTRSGNN